MAACAAGVQQERFAAVEDSTVWHGPVTHRWTGFDPEQRPVCLLPLLICIAPQVSLLPCHHERTSAFQSMTS